jgi:hypothetical protein
LISTGTWSICLNPFNQHPLTVAELQADCLCYLDAEGRQVKASRLHLGPMHETICRALSARFNMAPDEYTRFKYDHAFSGDLPIDPTNTAHGPEAAYHLAMLPLVDLQIKKLDLVLRQTTPKQIFIDGGFARNAVFMGLLASRLEGYVVHASSLPQASALGAAMAFT